MAQSSKTAVRLALLILAGLLCAVPARAQLSSGTPDPKSETDFAVITGKFIRNMKLLRDMTPEKEVVEKMDIVIDQSQSMLKHYRTGGSSQKRESLMREKKDLESASNVSKRNIDKINEIEAQIRALDPENYFGQARAQVKIAISNLYTVLDQVYTDDAERKDVIRVTRDHLQIFQFAMDKVAE